MSFFSVIAPAFGGAFDAAVGMYNQHRANTRADDAEERARADAQKDRDLQKEFAQNGIRWKAADAAAAGIHPVYAAGAMTSSYSPVASVGGGSTATYQTRFGDMGQDVSRAFTATRSAGERDMQLLQMGLLKSQIAETDARAGYYNSMIVRNAGPAVGANPFPSGAGQVTVVPDQVTSQRRDDPSTGAGTHPLFDQYYLDKNGRKVWLVSQKASESLENFGSVVLGAIRTAQGDGSKPAKPWGQVLHEYKTGRRSYNPRRVDPRLDYNR